VRERDHLEDPGVDGRVIVKYNFRKWDGGHGLDCSDFGYEQVAGSGKRGNEPSGSIKCGGFLDQLRTGPPREKVCAPRSK
jgi:hypothetical protein